MNKKLEFLYCLDQNYNKQALTSIISLLDLVDEKIIIHIIHKTSKFIDDIPKTITEHFNLDKIFVYEFKDLNYHFPNIDNVHITEATYYRIFIDKYLDKKIENLVFLDCDTICLSNPISHIKKELKMLNNSEKILAARTEYPKEFNISNEIYKRLDMNGPYFNAGVMLIDFQKWIINSIGKRLENNLNDYKEKILQWDQDVLNSFFDGDYHELGLEFNFPSSKINSKKDKILFAHFLGSKKPWSTSGAFSYSSELYHSNYRKIYNSK